MTTINAYVAEVRSYVLNDVEQWKRIIGPRRTREEAEADITTYKKSRNHPLPTRISEDFTLEKYVTRVLTPADLD